MLKDIILIKRPNLGFLMETKVSDDRIEQLASDLGFKGLFTVDSVGASEGLAMF